MYELPNNPICHYKGRIDDLAFFKDVALKKIKSSINRENDIFPVVVS